MKNWSGKYANKSIGKIEFSISLENNSTTHHCRDCAMFLKFYC